MYKPCSATLPEILLWSLSKARLATFQKIGTCLSYDDKLYINGTWNGVNKLRHSWELPIPQSTDSGAVARAALIYDAIFIQKVTGRHAVFWGEMLSNFASWTVQCQWKRFKVFIKIKINLSLYLLIKIRRTIDVKPNIFQEYVVYFKYIICILWFLIKRQGRRTMSEPQSQGGNRTLWCIARSWW